VRPSCDQLLRASAFKVAQDEARRHGVSVDAVLASWPKPGAHVRSRGDHGLYSLPGENVLTEDDELVGTVRIEKEELDRVAEIEVPKLVNAR
jgi:hypothetical protein